MIVCESGGHANGLTYFIFRFLRRPLKAEPARAVTPDQVRHTLDELLAESKASGQYPLPPEQREWVDAPAVGREWPACETLEDEGLANIASSDDGSSHRHS